MVEQFAGFEGFVAEDADFADFCDVAFFHGEVQADAVALQRGDGGGDLRAVFAAREVLAFELLLGAFQRGAVENQPFAQADIAQALFEGVFVEFLDAGEGDVGNRGAFGNAHDDDVVFYLDFYVAEKAGGKELAHRFGGLFFGEGVARAHGQVVEDGAWFGALNAFDADVAHHEGVKGPGGGGECAAACDETSGENTFHAGV